MQRPRRSLRFPLIGAISLLLVSPAGCSSAAATGTPTVETPESKDQAPATETAQETNDRPYKIADWWPNHLDLRPLRANAPAGDPMDVEFDYAKAYAALDIAAVKKDIEKVLTTSQPWWPADFGHYGGLMIRLAWHSSGTYRVMDGRGGAASGTIRFAPLNSWPDNANLDKARRLLWPVKQKYGRSLSWADLIVLSGNVALESMGFKTLGFGGGREDVYEPTDINWGPETEWLADQRFADDGQTLTHPVAATMMGLIYVNPEGPNGNPDPLASAQRIRTTFGRMGMNDEETVALIAGGHTLGKAHGAHKAADCLGPEPEAAPVEEQATGWKNKCGTGHGKDTVTSGLEGAWTSTPVQWSHGYFKNLFEKEWELTQSPGGAKQWKPEGDDAPKDVPDAHVKGKYNHAMMLTTDLALIKDPAYREISKRFYDDPKQFEAAFASAWFKLTHRDMGPRSRLVGSEVPEAQIWQDPTPKVNHPLVKAKHIKKLKGDLLESGLTHAELVGVAWASASTYRDTDHRGGANGARLRLDPQNKWAVNQGLDLDRVLPVLEGVQKKFNDGQRDGTRISMADLIVLGGAAAIEDAADKAGVKVKVPFAPGRTDATAEMTDTASFAVLEPKADGFRNFAGDMHESEVADALVERADFLRLTAPEMTVLVGGMRVLGANHDGSKYGAFTKNPGTLSNDYFVNLLGSNLDWTKTQTAAGTGQLYEGRKADTGEVVWTGSTIDLLFGSNSQLRAIAEVYAADDAKEKFVNDFVAAWTKVMQLDRFDMK